MKENKNLEGNLSEKVTNEEFATVEEANMEQKETEQSVAEDKEEEYYFTAAELRKQKKRAEKRKKRVEKEEKIRKRNIGRMYKSSAIIAVFAGVLQILMALPKEDGMNGIMLGATFICFGYLFYTMGNKATKEMKRQMENR